MLILFWVGVTWTQTINKKKKKVTSPPPLGDYQGPADEMYREAWVGFSGHVYMTVP